jgi:hypothetical protein
MIVDPPSPVGYGGTSFGFLIGKRGGAVTLPGLSRFCGGWVWRGVRAVAALGG